MIAWREQGRQPEQIVASGRIAGGGTRTRLLCPHPQLARYDGSGNADDASSYRCVAPGT
jgi:feruloyl esterase